DILALQGEVAQAIAEEVRIHLTPSERARLAGHRVVDPRTYELYLRGRHFWNKRNIPDVRRGIEFFNQAIEADPTWGAAYAGLAELRAVVAVGPGFLHAVHDLGRAYTERGSFEEAFECFRGAARRGAGDTRASAGLGRAYALAGLEREARGVLTELESRSREV